VLNGRSLAYFNNGSYFAKWQLCACHVSVVRELCVMLCSLSLSYVTLIIVSAHFVAGIAVNAVLKFIFFFLE
jgi:hypothetical protein